MDISPGSDHTQMVFKDRKENTIKDNHTTWISSSKIVETSPKKVKVAYNGRNKIKLTWTAKPKITDFEACIHPNHIPSEVIKQSIEHGIFGDVEES